MEWADWNILVLLGQQEEPSSSSMPDSTNERARRLHNTLRIFYSFFEQLIYPNMFCLGQGGEGSAFILRTIYLMPTCAWVATLPAALSRRM